MNALPLEMAIVFTTVSTQLEVTTAPVTQVIGSTLTDIPASVSHSLVIAILAVSLYSLRFPLNRIGEK